MGRDAVMSSGREWTALVVNGFGISRAVVSDGRRDDGQLFAGRAVHMHVPARDERELRGGEHAPRRHELVLRPCPRSRRLVVAVFTGLGGDKDDGLGEAVLDGRRRFGDHAQPETEALPGGSETQVVDQRRGQLTRCDAVDGSPTRFPHRPARRVPLPVPGFSTSRRRAAGLVVCCRHRRWRPYASSRSIVLRSCRTSVLIGDDAEVGAHYVVVPAAPDDRADLLGAQDRGEAYPPRRRRFGRRQVSRFLDL